MRKTPDDFGDRELDLVFIAKKLKEALRIEALFTERDIDYLVEPDHYVGGILFRTERIGAFFYVDAEHRESAVAVLAENGFKAHEGPPPDQS